MDSTLKFEFDFNEVFEGIKQGVIRELAEMNFDEAKEEAINKIKNEVKQKIKLTYSDERELINEIKAEVKEEVKQKIYDSIIKEVHDRCINEFENYVYNSDRFKKFEIEICDRVSNTLYSNIRGRIENKVNKIIDNFICNNIRTGDTSTAISIHKEEYEELLDKANKFNALENCGVDNWEGYDLAISSM